MGANRWMIPGGNLVGALGGMFGTDKPNFNNPANAGMPYLNQIPDMLKQYYNPYMQQGQSVYPGLQNQYSSMMNDPGAFLNKIGAGYKQSPGYQFALQQALQAGNNSAAAGGMLGTPMNQQQSMDTATGLASRDYDTWLNHALGIETGGLGGEQGMYDTGYKATTGLAENLGQNYMNQASMAGRGAEAQNQYEYNKQKSQADMWGGIGGALSMFGFM